MSFLCLLGRLLVLGAQGHDAGVLQGLDDLDFRGVLGLKGVEVLSSELELGDALANLFVDGLALALVSRILVAVVDQFCEALGLDDFLGLVRM